MKKFIYLLVMLVPALALVSCHDDDNDIPNVDFNLSFENAVEVDGSLYVVQGETMKITGIDVQNNEADKGALITAATYYWDGYYIGTTVQPPFGFEFDVTENVPVGKHQIEIECPLFAVDKSPATAIVFMYVNVVASEEEIPGQGSPEARVTPHNNTSTSK